MSSLLPPDLPFSERLDQILAQLERSQTAVEHARALANLRLLQDELRREEERRRVPPPAGREAALLQAISDATSDVVFAKDREGRLIFANPATLALVGRPLAQVLGKTDAEVLQDPEAAREVMANDRRIMERGAPEDLEEIVPRPDGTERVWLSRKTPYRDAAGHVIGLLGVSRDITETKAAITAARVARERLETVLDSITDGFLVMDRDWRFTYFSKTAARIAGVRQEDMLGRTVWELFPYVKDTLFFEKYHLAVATGEPQHFDEFYPEPVNKWLRCHCYPSREGLSVYFRDVTESKRADESLRRSEARLRAVFRAIEEGVVFLNPEGGIEAVNDAVGRRHGHTLPEFADPGSDSQPQVVRADGTAFPAEEQPAMVALRTGRAVRDVEMGVRLPDGQWRWRVVNAQPVRDDEGGLLGAVASFYDITDRKAAEAELRAQRELLAGIIDRIPVMLTIYDPQLRTFRFNREWRQVLGWTEADAADGDFMVKVYPDPVVRAAAGEYMQSLQAGWRDLEPVAKDGTKVLSSWANIRLANDTQIGIGIDIRQRKAAEEALQHSEEAMRASEERYRSFVAASTQVVWMTDSRGEVNFEIPAWQAFTGQTAEQARGFGWLDAVHPDDRAAVTEAWSRAFAASGVYEVEYRLRRHDGAWRHVLARGLPVTDASGRVREYVGTCIDVTESRLAEEARRQSEARLRLTTDALPVLISYVDAEQRYRFTNAAYVDWFGFRPAPGQPVREVLGEESYATRLPYMERALAGEAVVFDDTMPHLTKGRCATETSYVPDFAEDGKTIRGFIALVYDITDRRATEEALRQATREAQQASEAKDHFLAVLSHELRTPLTPVLATAQMLEADTGLTPEHRDLVQMIRRNIELEARLIDDLLDLTRIARNKLELQLASVDVHEKLSHVLRMCGEDIAAKQLVVSTDFGAAAHHVRADPARFQQILWNLLKNAVKFTPSGGRITVRTANRPSGSIAVEISDNGVGIDPLALPRIFDAFEQGGRDVTRQFGGLGLGLAISKALVEMHGGRIEAQSAGKGAGSCFVVTLPSVAAVPRPKLGAAARRKATLGRSILLVEDHADTRLVMARLLTWFGCKVTTAGTVAEALRAGAAQSFDLLISDIGLPDGSGLDIMRALKASQRVQGIALSGFGTDEDLARSKDAGFDTHLTKPVNLHALEEAVRRLTE